MKRLLDQLENESLSEVGIARIERKLTILRKLQEEEGQES